MELITYQGYYVGLNTSGQIILRKSDNNWAEIKCVSTIIKKTTPHHLRVVAKGSEIKVYIGDMNSAKLEVMIPLFKTV